MTRAMERLHLTWGRSRQVFGQRRVSRPSRFLEEIPSERLERSGMLPPAPLRHGLFPDPARSRAGEAPAPGPAPAHGELRPGVRVRHPLFGVGTVLRREGGGEDLKLTVSFPGVGAKKLVARFAGLELV